MNSINTIIIGASILLSSSTSLYGASNAYKPQSISDSTRSIDFQNIDHHHFEKEIKDFYVELSKNQKQLPADILAIMNKNMDYLYEPIQF